MKENKWIWFNIGQKGMHYVTWQCAIIKDNFNPETIRFQDYEWNEKNKPIEKWVPKEKLNVKLHPSVEMSFKDLNKVAKWIKDTYESGEDQYVGNNNWTHIYNVFDMNDVNEYGIAKALWD